jgi:hypothetical protein
MALIWGEVAAASIALIVMGICLALVTWAGEQIPRPRSRSFDFQFKIAAGKRRNDPATCAPIGWKPLHPLGSRHNKDAINQATLARTKTLAAQQDAERAKVEAQTRVIQAQAEADADAQAARAGGQARAQLAQAQAEADGNLARARAEAEGNLVKAKTDAEALRLRGEADAAATRARIEAAGGADNYVRQIDAQSKLRWNGQVPQFVLGGAGANAPAVPVILPLQAQPAGHDAPAQAAR